MLKQITIKEVKHISKTRISTYGNIIYLWSKKKDTVLYGKMYYSLSHLCCNIDLS